MRKWTFVIFIVGMFVLFLFLGFEPRIVDCYSDLENLELNSRVIVSGVVVDEFVIYETQKVSTLDNGVEVVVDSGTFVNYLGSEIEVLGVVGDYLGTKQVEAESILIKK